MLRREKDKQGEILFDVDEPVLNLFSDEDDRSGLHRPPLAGNIDDSASRDNVVDLILGMW
jgi:hypothetical protein